MSERAMVFAEGRQLQPDHFAPEIGNGSIKAHLLNPWPVLSEPSGWPKYSPARISW